MTVTVTMAAACRQAILAIGVIGAPFRRRWRFARLLRSQSLQVLISATRS
jgi:hypothetical protein